MGGDEKLSAWWSRSRYDCNLLRGSTNQIRQISQLYLCASSNNSNDAQPPSTNMYQNNQRLRELGRQHAYISNGNANMKLQNRDPSSTLNVHREFQPDKQLRMLDFIFLPSLLAICAGIYSSSCSSSPSPVAASMTFCAPSATLSAASLTFSVAAGA